VPDKRCKVYRFEYQDYRTGAWVLTDDLALERAIKEILGRIVPGSEVLVDASLVSRSGYVISDPRARWRS
jgi:hypothetical protein